MADLAPSLLKLREVKMEHGNNYVRDGNPLF